MKDPGFLESPRGLLRTPMGKNNLKVQPGSKSDLAVAPSPPPQVILFPRPTRNPEGAAGVDEDWCWHRGLGPT